MPGVTIQPCLTKSLSTERKGPTHFGPSAEAATPWLALALYLALRSGPPSVVLVAGQRLWRLPPQLAACSHALLWPWDLDALRAQARPVTFHNLGTAALSPKQDALGPGRAARAGTPLDDVECTRLLPEPCSLHHVALNCDALRARAGAPRTTLLFCGC